MSHLEELVGIKQQLINLARQIAEMIEEERAATRESDDLKPRTFGKKGDHT